MSGAPRVRSANIAELDSRTVLVPSGNKTKLVSSNSRKLASKSVRKVDGKKAEEKMGSASASDLPPPLLPSSSASKVLRRQEVLLRSNFSLNASCSSDCSTESFRSRASTGRIVNGGRPGFTNRRRQGVPRPERIASKLERVVVPEGIEACSPEVFEGKMRCPWITRNTESCYVAFHDEEWGVPVHDDKKLFELLVLCGALAELTWPIILSKRHIFREVFMDFDPVEISKLNENKIISLGSSASSLLTEPKLRAIVENARQILKIIEECGSFDRYCWSFVNNKPIVSRFRYSRQVPVKTSKADIISRDLMKRGFRCVGPTIIYSFMQVAGLTNDHLTCCYRFEECCAPIQANPKIEENSSLTCTTNTTAVAKQVDMSVIIDLELDRCVDDLNIS